MSGKTSGQSKEDKTHNASVGSSACLSSVPPRLPGLKVSFDELALVHSGNVFTGTGLRVRFLAFFFFAPPSSSSESEGSEGLSRLSIG